MYYRVSYGFGRSFSCFTSSYQVGLQYSFLGGAVPMCLRSKGLWGELVVGRSGYEDRFMVSVFLYFVLPYLTNYGGGSVSLGLGRPHGVGKIIDCGHSFKSLGSMRLGTTRT